MIPPLTSSSSHPDNNPSPAFASRAAGFSLIELLVVIAIIGVLAGFALPAFSSIGQARGVSDAVFQLAAAAELARNEAVARQTYVWLGMQDQTNFGNRDLRIGIVYSKDGSTNTAQTNLQALGRASLIQRVGLVDPGSLNVGTNLSSAANLLTNSAGSFQIANQTFTNTILTFTPDGEALLTRAPSVSTPFESQIAVGLRAFRGIAPMTNNDAAILIDGSVGLPRILQNQ